MAQQMCRHRGCTCQARSDGYCSAYCAGEQPAAEEFHVCACGHDDCEPPSKFESKAAFGDQAPQGRTVEKYTRDW